MVDRGRGRSRAGLKGLGRSKPLMLTSPSTMLGLSVPVHYLPGLVHAVRSRRMEGGLGRQYHC